MCHVRPRDRRRYLGVRCHVEKEIEEMLPLTVEVRCTQTIRSFFSYNVLSPSFHTYLSLNSVSTSTRRRRRMGVDLGPGTISSPTVDFL